MLEQITMQSRALYRVLFLIILIPLLFLAAVAVISVQTEHAIGTLTRDPMTVANLHPITGVVSNVGVLTWAVGAAVSLFTAVVLLRRGDERPFALFLLTAGLLTAWLLLDDFFLLHEIILPHYLGLTERPLFLIYGTLGLGWFFLFRNEIRQTDFLLLLSGVFFFGASILIDGFQENVQAVVGEWRILLEDGFKFIGIFGWCAYLVRCCARRLTTA